MICYYCNRYGINIARSNLNKPANMFSDINCMHCGQSTCRREPPGLTALEHQLYFLDIRVSVNTYCSRFKIKT